MEETTLVHGYGNTGSTLLHPFIGLIIVIGMAIIFIANSRMAVAAFISLVILIPMSQRIVLGGFDLYGMRILLLFGWLRVAIRSKRRRERLSHIDKLFLAWTIFSGIAYMVLWKTFGAFVYRVGIAFSNLGIYFLLRRYITCREDVDKAIEVLAYVSFIVAFGMLVERFFGRNLFALMGGFSGDAILREGRIRSAGPFSHPILAGIFGATLFPVIVGRWWSSSSTSRRRLFLLGGLSTTLIVVLSASSGPMLAYFAGVIGLMLWYLRHHTRGMLLAMLLSLACLQIFMKAPIWALIGRFDLVSGSSGYHRFLLMDQFIKRVPEWFLFGVKSTQGWGWLLHDTSNQYVDEGVKGGMIALVLFITMFVKAFKQVGRNIATFVDDKSIQKEQWSLGAALVAHLMGFIGTAYFGQEILLLFSLFVFIQAVSLQSDHEPGLEKSRLALTAQGA